MARNKATIVFDQDDVDTDAGIYRDENGKRTIDIGEWDMNRMHPHNVDDLEHGSKVIIIGKPGLGKSRVTQAIMMYKAHICPVGQFFSGTETVNHFYEEMVPSVLVYNDLNIKAMETFAKRQDIARKYLPNPWAIQVLDDVTDDPSVLGKPPFGAYFRKGRHWAMIHIECVQYPMDLKPAMRSCVDYIFLMANGILSERQKLYENFGSGSIPTFQDFCDIMDGITEDHTALVIDNTIHSNNVKDRIFYFRADLDRIPRDWKFGCNDAWKFSEDRVDTNYNPSVI